MHMQSPKQNGCGRVALLCNAALKGLLQKEQLDSNFCNCCCGNDFGRSSPLPDILAICFTFVEKLFPQSIFFLERSYSLAVDK